MEAKISYKKILILMLIVVVQFLFSQFLFTQNLKYKEKIELNKELQVKKLFLFEGNCYILSANSIYSFNKKGQFINTISNKGEGPGEFENITDFTITNNEKIIVGGVRTGNRGKISIFEMNGKLVKDYKIDFTTKAVFYFNDIIYYSTNDTVFHKLKNKSGRFETLTLDLFSIKKNTPIISFPDNSQINPPHFSGKDYPFPWFPGPYPNRVFIILDKNGQFIVFQSKEKYFLRIQNNESTKIAYKFDLKDVPVTNDDKREFFEQIETVNERKFPRKIKNSIVFPKIKDHFNNVFLWNQNFVLTTESLFLVISNNGELQFKIKIPDEIVKNEEDISWAANRICVKENNLYYVNDEGILYKFEIIKNKKDS